MQTYSFHKTHFPRSLQISPIYREFKIKLSLSSILHSFLKLLWKIGREKERKAETDWTFTGWLHKYLQQVELSQLESMSPEPKLDLPHDWQRPKDEPLPAIPRTHINKKLDGKTEPGLKPRRLEMGFGSPKQCPDPCTRHSSPWTSWRILITNSDPIRTWAFPSLKHSTFPCIRSRKVTHLCGLSISGCGDVVTFTSSLGSPSLPGKSNVITFLWRHLLAQTSLPFASLYFCLLVILPSLLWPTYLVEHMFSRALITVSEST